MAKIFQYVTDSRPEITKTVMGQEKGKSTYSVYPTQHFKCRYNDVKNAITVLHSSAHTVVRAIVQVQAYGKWESWGVMLNE